jgi:hypothetical protein
MNTNQVKGLQRLRDNFVSGNSALSELDFGTVHTKLDSLTIKDLRYLAIFPSLVNNSVIDLELSMEQVQDDTSPVYDIAKAAKVAGKKASQLEDAFGSLRAAFMDHMASDFRLESVIEEPNYKEILNEVGLNEETITITFLRSFDPIKAAQAVKDEILGHFGYSELVKMYVSGGPAILLDRLIEREPNSKDQGPNPVLFEALAGRMMDSFCEERYGKLGFVNSKGNVTIKLVNTDGGKFQIPPNAMVMFEAGLSPLAFKITEGFEDSFPNTPTMRIRAVSYKPASLLSSIDHIFSDKASGADIVVRAQIFESQAAFKQATGSVTVKP